MYYSFFFLIALVLEGLGQMDCAGVAGVIPGLKGASATCNLQPGNQLDCLLQIPEPRKSTGLIQIRKIPQPGKKSDRFVPNSLPGCAQDRDDPVPLTRKNCCVVGGQYYGNTFPHQSPRLSLLQSTC